VRSCWLESEFNSVILTNEQAGDIVISSPGLLVGSLMYRAVPWTITPDTAVSVCEVTFMSKIPLRAWSIRNIWPFL